MHDPVAEFDRLIAAKEPDGGYVRLSVPLGAQVHIGHIVLQWGQLMHTVGHEVGMFKLTAKVPQTLRDAHTRAEARYQLAFLRDVAEHVFADEREGALKLYLQNLSRVTRHKGVRDALAHGMFTATDNEDYPGVVAIYKKRKLYLTMQTLADTASGIGQCHVFFLEFRKWVLASKHRELFLSLEESREHDPQPTSRDTPDTP